MHEHSRVRSLLLPGLGENVQAVMVNTLVSSDYGLVDEDTHVPRPDF
jgi:hypothetical protein